ncbi:MAG TPA: TetR/AcrR family transcriptional regulator [Acidimicrobiia bacterium]|nr:TetR/AcrR family transcriptional regulator [Acidimicrobiia bacterium]
MSSRKLERERQILDVAAVLFRERGYQGMRMDDLAATVNLNKGTLYHYFPSKAELLYRIYLDTSSEFLAAVRQHPADAPPDELLTLIIRDIATAMDERRDYVTVYFQEMHWLDKWLEPERFEEINALQVEFRNYITGVIERGVKEGAFRPLDASVAAFAVIGMVGWSYQWFTPGGRYSMDDLAAIFTDLTLAAFRDGQPSPVADGRASKAARRKPAGRPR